MRSRSVCPLEEFHREEIPAANFSNLVDGADVGVVQRRSGSRFAAKPLRGLRVVDRFIGKEFEGDEAAEFQILGLVDLTHASTADLFQNTVVREGFSMSGSESAIWRSS
jgi:hypothetical protein